MNNQIRETLANRAVIMNNLENLIKYGNDFKKNSQQLSLFGSSIEAKPRMIVPDYINFDDMIKKEKDALGVCLTYDIFNRYILLIKRFCNNNVMSLNSMTESKLNGIILIASIADIEYKKSIAGNNYAKITIQDANDSCNVFLWGTIYQTHISKVIKDKLYMIELGYNKENESVFILNIKDLNSIDPKEHISTIVLGLNNFSNVVAVRKYVFESMFYGTLGDYNLIFKYNDDEIVAPYKIKFTEEDYLFLKNHITHLDVIK